MSKQKYQHTKFLEEEMLAMQATGKAKKSISQHFGLTLE